MRPTFFRSSARAAICNQLGAILDQFLGPHRKDIELGTADHETDVLEQATDLVLEIALDLDQQRPARQQRPNRVALEALDAHLLKPAGLHDAGDAGRIAAVKVRDKTRPSSNIGTVRGSRNSTVPCDRRQTSNSPGQSHE